jgi:hypothetical protein
MPSRKPVTGRNAQPRGGMKHALDEPVATFEAKSKGDQTMQTLIHALSPGLLFLAMMMAGLSGCEREEKVIDIETPAGDVEVERSLDDGSVDVKVDQYDKDDQNE